MKIKLEFENEPDLIDFSESEFESIAKACDGQNPLSIAEAMSDVLEVLHAVSVREIVVRMAKLLHLEEQQAIATDILRQWGEDDVKIAVEAVCKLSRDEQEKIATDILGQWGKDIVNSVGKTTESESANKDHGRP